MVLHALNNVLHFVIISTLEIASITMKMLLMPNDEPYYLHNSLNVQNIP